MRSVCESGGEHCAVCARAVGGAGILQQRGSARGRTPGSRDGVLGRGGSTWPAAVDNGGSAADTATEGKKRKKANKKRKKKAARSRVQTQEECSRWTRQQQEGMGLGTSSRPMADRSHVMQAELSEIRCWSQQRQVLQRYAVGANSGSAEEAGSTRGQ